MRAPIHIENFEQEMERRFMSKKTTKNYSSCSKKYLYYFKEKEHPLHITDEEFKKYLFGNFHDQSTQRANHSAIKKFYEVVFNKDRFKYVKYAQKKETQIIILSEDEMRRLLQAMTNLMHFCITLLFYSTGIRIGELLNIEYARDIDIANGVIYVMGKGAKPRPVTMKPKLREVIEAHILKHKPKRWLFENEKTHRQYSEGSINAFLKYNAKKAGITKRVHAHLIRHCYASHSIMISGLYMVQEMLGHSDPKITASTYIHNSPKLISQAYSPIDSLQIPDMKSLPEHGKSSGSESKAGILPADKPEKVHDKTYNVLLNGKTYLLKERNNKIVDAPEGAKWSIGVLTEKALTWFEKKGATINISSQ